MAEILDLTQAAQTEKEYDRILRGQVTNEVIASYYETFAAIAEAEGDYDTFNLFTNKASNLRTCHKIMFFNHYQNNAVKDYRKTFYCHDRYCPNCQKLIANTREQKFRKILAELESQYDFYHMVLTLKNVRGKIPYWKPANRSLSELAPYLRTMSESFKHLTRFFTGNAKISGMDFSRLGYAGAVRTLEVTYKDCQEYHPHFHSLVAMRKGLRFGGKTINKFSYNKFTGKVTPFSDFEIQLQKIWFLILNGQRVTADAIKSLPLGYSCQFKRVLPKESHDVFKYIVKPDKNAVMTEEVFQDLYFSLKGMRSIQTYGCFHGYKLESDDIDNSFDPLYDSIIQMLNNSERPVECGESPKSVRDNIAAKKFVYISRKSIRSFVRSIGAEDDDFSFIAKAPKKLVELVQSVMPGVLDRPTSSLLYLDGGRPIFPKHS